MATIKYNLIALTIALVLLLSACVTPSATQSTQTSPLRKGDGFTMLSPVAEGHPLRAMDAVVLNALSSRTGSVASGRQWLLEYSYAVRPADIAMKSDDIDHGMALPQSNAMLECAKTSHRVTVRILAKDDGAQSYRGTAELVDCRSDVGMDEQVFSDLLGLAISNLTIE